MPQSPAASVARRRLAAQQLVRRVLASGRDVVRALGAVQAQDYSGAKWAIAQRIAGAPTDAGIEREHDTGAIVRTHILRPTWHFVAADDLRWMLALSAPRVRASMIRRSRELGVDEPFIRRSNDIIARALEGRQHLTRAELLAILRREGIDASDTERSMRVVFHAELDGVVCSGPRRGKQFTYALLDERVPAAAAIDRDEAIAELARRYFSTRGPATLNDWAWWSGLTVADGKRAIAALGDVLEREEIDGVPCWSAADAPVPRWRAPVARLLPPYDELFIGYRDRGALLERAPDMATRWAAAAMSRVLAVDGQLLGLWSVASAARRMKVKLDPFVRISAAEREAFAAQVDRYAAFLGLAASTD